MRLLQIYEKIVDSQRNSNKIKREKNISCSSPVFYQQTAKSVFQLVMLAGLFILQP